MPHAALWYLCGQKAFPLGGVYSGPVEIDGFQSYPRHGPLSSQTFDVQEVEHASMTNIHSLLCKTARPTEPLLALCPCDAYTQSSSDWKIIMGF